MVPLSQLSSRQRNQELYGKSRLVSLRLAALPPLLAPKETWEGLMLEVLVLRR
jgi:hypothetical protein